MKRGLQGTFIRITMPEESYQVFLPKSLPPEPQIQFDSTLRYWIEKAYLSLGRLDALAQILPDITLFLYMYVRKEALLSSQIEGTQSSLSDLLLYESQEVPGVPINDVVEVSNYVAALFYGINRIREGFPICSRLFREIHAKLLSSGRGSEKEPGEYRRSQNWIGGSRPGNAVFVPPPHNELNLYISELEKYIHNQMENQENTSALIKAALVHVQFETIHPFLDGNGRIGRLLIPLILSAEKVLTEPLLYLSLYFKNNRNRYYELLQSVRLEGDWESWIIFFLEGISVTAEQAVLTVRKILDLFLKDREKIEKFGRSSGNVLRVHQLLQKKVILSIPEIAKEVKLSYITVQKSLSHLEESGMVREISGRRRNKIYVYQEYFNLLSEGTEPLKPEPANL